MYGKLMSITDPLVGDYFELLTDVTDEELAAIREAVGRGGTGARDAKMRLAREIVSQFHGAEAGDEAENEFRRVFSKREAPAEALDLPVAFNGAASMEIDLTEALVSAGVAASKSDVRRLVSQGAVEADDVPVKDFRASVREGTIIRVGKHRFVRVVDTDGAPRGDG